MGNLLIHNNHEIARKLSYFKVSFCIPTKRKINIIKNFVFVMLFWPNFLSFFRSVFLNAFHSGALLF